jgi:hypothetical protein
MSIFKQMGMKEEGMESTDQHEWARMGTKKPRPICLSEEAGFADEETLQRGHSRCGAGTSGEGWEEGKVWNAKEGSPKDSE